MTAKNSYAVVDRKTFESLAALQHSRDAFLTVKIAAEHYNPGAKILASVKDPLYWVVDMGTVFSIAAIGLYSAVQVKFMHAERPAGKKFTGMAAASFGSVILDKIKKDSSVKFFQPKEGSIALSSLKGCFTASECRHTISYELLLERSQASNAIFFDLCDTDSLEIGASSSKKVATLSLSRNEGNSGLILGRDCIKSSKQITMNLQLLKPLFVNPFDEDDAPEILASEVDSSGMPIRFQRHFTSDGLIVDMVVKPIRSKDMGSDSPDIPFDEEVGAEQ